LRSPAPTLAIPWLKKGDGSPSPFLLATRMCTNFPTSISTDRLTLRPYRSEDAPRVRALADDYDIAKMVASFPHPYPEGLAESWIGTHDTLRAARKGYPFAIEVDGEVVGSIGVEDTGNGDFELGYWLGRAYWNKGLATEAATAVLRFAFGWRALPYLRSRFITENRASARVLDKAGFLATGRERLFHKVRNRDVELTNVILTRDAWASNRV
jgi:RimJ/RimL family protein N-acetyltransferase